MSNYHFSFIRKFWQQCDVYCVRCQNECFCFKRKLRDKFNNTSGIKMNQVKNIDLFYSVIKEVLELIELVKCPVCLRVCSEPTIFSCNHTFCLSCIQNRFKETPLGKRSTCPVCQKVLNKRQKCRNEQAEYIVTYINGISHNLQNICQFNIFSDKGFIKFIDRYLPRKQTNANPVPSTSTNVTTRSKKPSVKTKLDSFKSNGTRESSELDAFDKLLAGSNTASVKSVKTYKNKKKEEAEKTKVEVFDKVVEFEDSKSKEDIIKWLLDSKNEFDRLTQSTQGSIEEFYPEEDLLSISQSAKAKKEKNAKKSREKRKCRSLGINANAKMKSSLKRHTLGVLNNAHEKIEISDSDSEDLNKIVNLVEDDFIDSLNQFVEPKTVKEKKSKKTSGWARMQNLAKKAKRTTPSQKLKISLASQKKNDVSKSSLQDVTLVNIQENETKLDESKDDVIVIEDADADSNKNDETLLERNIAGNKKDAIKSKENIVTMNENVVTMKENVVTMKENVVTMTENVVTMKENVVLEEDVEVVEDSEEEEKDGVSSKKLIPYVRLTQMESFFEKYMQNESKSEYSVCNSDSRSNIIESSIPTAPDELQIAPQLQPASLHELQIAPQLQPESPQKEIVHNINNITKEFELATEDNKANPHQNSSTDSDFFAKVTQQISDDFKFEDVLSEYIVQYNSIKEHFKKFNSLTEKSAQLTNSVKIVERIFDKLKPEIDKINRILNKEENVENANHLEKESSCNLVCKDFLEKAIQTEETVLKNEKIHPRNYLEKCVQTDNFVCMKCTQQITKPNFFVSSSEFEEMDFNTQHILANEMNQTVRKLETQKETSNSNESSRKSSGYSGRQTAKICSDSGRQNKKTNSSSKTQTEETITQIMENLEVVTENSEKLVKTTELGESEDTVPSSENVVTRRSARIIVGNLSGKNSGSASKTKSDNSERTSTALVDENTAQKLKNTLTTDALEKKTVAPRFHKNKSDIISATEHRLPLKTIEQDEAVASTRKRVSQKFKKIIKPSFEEFDENVVIPDTDDFVFNSNEILNRFPTNAENEDEIFASITSNLKKLSQEQNKVASKRNSQVQKTEHRLPLKTLNLDEGVASTSKRLSQKSKNIIKRSFEEFDENDVIPETDDFVFNPNESLNILPKNAENEDEVFASTRSHLKKLSQEQNKVASKSNSQVQKTEHRLPLKTINLDEAAASTSKRLSQKSKNIIKRSFEEFDENDVIPETEDFAFNPSGTLNRLPKNAENEGEIFASTRSHLKKFSQEENKVASKSNSQVQKMSQIQKENTKYLGDVPKKLYNVDLSAINHEGDPILEAIFKENPQITSLDSDLVISIEPVTKRKLQFPETNGEGNKFKRIRLLSSDSESNEANAKKAKNKFIRDDVSIHFDTETQFGKSPEEEIMKVASLGSSDFNMDYVDQVWDKIDKGLLRTDRGTSSPPKKKIKTLSTKETKSQEILAKCDQIINDVTNKMTYNKATDMGREKEKVRELLRSTIEDVGIENWQNSFIPDEVSYDQPKTVIENKCLNYAIEEFTNENSVEKEMELMFKSNSPKENKVSQLEGNEGILNNNKNVINILQDVTLRKKDFDGSLTIVPETNSMEAALQDFDVNKAIEEINTQASQFKKKKELDVIVDSDEELFKSDTEQDVIESTPPKPTNRTSQSSKLENEDVCAIPPPLEFQDFSNKTLVSETSQIIQSNRLLTSKISVSQPYLHSLSPIAKTTKHKLINVGSPTTSCPIKLTSTPKTQKQSTLSKFMKKTQEKPEELFKLKFRSKPCIACTRLSKEQILAISSLCNKRLATYSTVFNNDTTHMIVSTNENNSIKDHTIKFVSAVAAGIWVLSFNWVLECITKKTIVPEEPYEVLDVSGIPGPRESRLNRKKRPLFKGFKIHAASPFASTTQSDVENIVTLLGGKVASKLDDLLDSKGYICLIITETRSSQDFELYEGWLEALKVVTVDIEWLSRSVGQYKLMSLRRFALCSDDTLGELGYPQELLEMVPYSFSQSPFN